MTVPGYSLQESAPARPPTPHRDGWSVRQATTCPALTGAGGTRRTRRRFSPPDKVFDIAASQSGRSQGVRSDLQCDDRDCEPSACLHNSFEAGLFFGQFVESQRIFFRISCVDSFKLGLRPASPDAREAFLDILPARSLLSGRVAGSCGR